MSETEQHRETAVERVRRVRDQLNQEIRAVTAAELLEHIREHRYTSPCLQRLASKAASKTQAPAATSSSR